MSKIMLPHIELSEEEYQKLWQCKFVGYGSEANVFRDGDEVVKIFRDDFGQKKLTEEEVEEVRENKFQKIKLLASKEIFDNPFKPLISYSYQGRFIGYRGKFFRCFDIQDSFDFGVPDREVTFDEKVFYLKEIRRKLKLFHEDGLVYGDIKTDNILVDFSQQLVIFFDIDNMKVWDYPIDIKTHFANDFMHKYGVLDEKLDSYMMNLMTIELLCDCRGWYSEVIQMLENDYVPREVACPKNRVLAREMGHVDKNYSGQYFIDNL